MFAAEGAGRRHALGHGSRHILPAVDPLPWGFLPPQEDIQTSGGQAFAPRAGTDEEIAPVEACVRVIAHLDLTKRVVS